MKNAFSRITDPVLLLTIVFTVMASCKGAVPEKEKPVKSVDSIAEAPESQDSIPLLVMSSFLDNRTVVSQRELRSMLSGRKCFVTADVAQGIVQLFHLNTSPISISVDAFFARKDTSLLITSIDSVIPRGLVLKVDSVDFFRHPSTYPLKTILNGRSFDFDKQVTSYTHTGVTAITRQTGIVLDRVKAEKYLANIIDRFKDRELLHMSNEVSRVDACDYSSMKLGFATRADHFELLSMLGADVIELTGNHNLDFGVQPYLKTLDWYREKKMSYFGGGTDQREASMPLVRELKDGSRVAWIGYNESCPLGECAGSGPGACRYKKALAGSMIDSLKQKAGVGFVIACVQFGEIDSYSPTSSQKQICRDLIDLGADAVMGSQAHQTQEIAFYKNKPLFYGLGNFLFDQIHKVGVRQAYFLECYFYKGRIIQYQPVYTFMSTGRIPTIASPAERETIRQATLLPGNF